MKINKRGEVLVETTNTVYGMLEQGGVSGRVVAYKLGDVLAATGLMDERAIANHNEHDYAPSYGNNCISIRDAIERECVGRVVKPGVIIQ